MNKTRTLLLVAIYSLLAVSMYATELSEQLPRIHAIHINGNSLIPEETLIHRLPYRVGGFFDTEKSAAAITSLYSLGLFEQILIEKEMQDDGTIDLFVTVTENPSLAGITFSGNKALNEKKLREVIDE